MTIEEFKKLHFQNYAWDEYSAELLAVEYAKYHVEQALNTVFKNGVIKSTKREYEGVLIEITNIVESSIINTYPLENIK